jgi:hypothetical protein
LVAAVWLSAKAKVLQGGARVQALLPVPIPETGLIPPAGGEAESEKSPRRWLATMQS